jgi:hypothetical protein
LGIGATTAMWTSVDGMLIRRSRILAPAVCGASPA